MHKENYLYFMSADDEPCDKGSKSLQEQKLIPQVSNGQIGKVALIKNGNKTHFVLICKKRISDRVTEETLHQLSISLRETLINTPIEVLIIAKTEIDNFKWIIFNYIHKSLIGLPIKLVICHGLVQIPEIRKRL